MSREWKPGDVAMVTAANRTTEYRAYYDGNTWRECGASSFCVDCPASLRPLVVLDPEDREQVGRLTKAMPWAMLYTDAPRVADALRSLIVPPKPPEPQGLGAVVEDAGGLRYVRSDVETCNPWRDTKGYPHEWDDFTAVKILSAGVRDE